MAPVLPGLSDAPEQLDAVAKACVEAGARPIATVLLHLRPGVREHYLGWLGDARPDLVARYDELYPRAYAPKDAQQRVCTLVAQSVERHGGRTTRPEPARTKSPPRPKPPAAAGARQLGLDL